MLGLIKAVPNVLTDDRLIRECPICLFVLAITRQIIRSVGSATRSRQTAATPRTRHADQPASNPRASLCRNLFFNNASLTPTTKCVSGASGPLHNHHYLLSCLTLPRRLSHRQFSLLPYTHHTTALIAFNRRQPQAWMRQSLRRLSPP